MSIPPSLTGTVIPDNERNDADWIITSDICLVIMLCVSQDSHPNLGSPNVKKLTTGYDEGSVEHKSCLSLPFRGLQEGRKACLRRFS